MVPSPDPILCLSLNQKSTFSNPTVYVGKNGYPLLAPLLIKPNGSRRESQVAPT